jgi:hypothetical protein
MNVREAGDDEGYSGCTLDLGFALSTCLGADGEFRLAKGDLEESEIQENRHRVGLDGEG